LIRHVLDVLPPCFAGGRRHGAVSGCFADYVQALRVEEAKKILETEEFGIDETAEAVGYDDPASFRRLFKRKPV
jgi:transcriptional regulator GlxA family with amidase domain